MSIPWSEDLVRAGAYIIESCHRKHRPLADRAAVEQVLTDSSLCDCGDDGLKPFGYTVRTFYQQTRSLSPQNRSAFMDSVVQQWTISYGSP